MHSQCENCHTYHLSIIGYHISNFFANNQHNKNVVGFVPPPPLSFEVVYCYIYHRQRVAVAQYRMICHVFDWFVVVSRHIQQYFSYLVTGLLSSFLDLLPGTECHRH